MFMESQKLEVGQKFKDGAGNQWELTDIDERYHFVALTDTSDMKKGRTLNLLPKFLKNMTLIK